MHSTENIDEHTVQVIEDPASLDPLGEALDEFDRKVPSEIPYLSSSFLRPWLVYASAHAKLHTLLLWKGRQIAAVLPLVSDTVRRGPIAVHRLGFPTHGGHPPSFDLLCEEEAAAVAAEALLSSFLKSGAPWRVLSLRHLSGDSAMLKILPRMCAERGLSYSWYPSRRESYLVLSGGWDSYLKRLGKAIRKQLSRGFRRVQETDGWEFVHEWPAAADTDLVHERYLRLMERSWKSRQAGDKAFAGLLEDVMRAFARRGDLLVSWLKGPGVDGAGVIQLRRGGSIASFHLAYAEDCPIPGPGTLLKGSAIAYAFEAGLISYDFSTYAEHIHRWHTAFRNSADVYITRRNPAGWLIQREMGRWEARFGSQ